MPKLGMMVWAMKHPDLPEESQFEPVGINGRLLIISGDALCFQKCPSFEDTSFALCLSPDMKLLGKLVAGLRKGAKESRL